jgi:hypothetical protein
MIESGVFVHPNDFSVFNLQWPGLDFAFYNRRYVLSLTSFTLSFYHTLLNISTLSLYMICIIICICYLWLASDCAVCSQIHHTIYDNFTLYQPGGLQFLGENILATILEICDSHILESAPTNRDEEGHNEFSQSNIFYDVLGISHSHSHFLTLILLLNWLKWNEMNSMRFVVWLIQLSLGLFPIFYSRTISIVVHIIVAILLVLGVVLLIFYELKRYQLLLNKKNHPVKFLFLSMGSLLLSFVSGVLCSLIVSLTLW